MAGAEAGPRAGLGWRIAVLVATVVMGVLLVRGVLHQAVDRPPGDYDAEVGMLRLQDGLLDEAMARFDAALEEDAGHPGARMGRALVFIERHRYDAALSALDALIDALKAAGTADGGHADGLAAAYANKGIVLDRLGRYERALASYRLALDTDRNAVSGPGLLHAILHGSDTVSSVADRARYLAQQLQLPESERLMLVPELDARQDAYQP
jgi:tetratricopeptide (TPR) repeat protein